MRAQEVETLTITLASIIAVLVAAMIIYGVKLQKCRAGKEGFGPYYLEPKYSNEFGDLPPAPYTA